MKSLFLSYTHLPLVKKKSNFLRQSVKIPPNLALASPQTYPLSLFQLQENIGTAQTPGPWSHLKVTFLF